MGRTKVSNNRLTSERAEKKTRIFGAARRDPELQGRQLGDQDTDAPLSHLWTLEDELSVDLSFTPESQEENAPRLAPPRVFVNHLEPFEESKYMKKEDGPLTARLRRKYVGVRFFDDDEDDHFEIVGVVFKKTSARKGCYCVTVQLVQELGGDVVDDDPETYIINEELHRMVSLEVQTSGIQLSEQ